MQKDHFDDGGPAFPLPLGTLNCSEPNESGGMTLRDYFAAKALPSAILGLDGAEGSATEPLIWLDEDSESGRSDCSLVARRAYAMADAMIKARSA